MIHSRDITHFDFCCGIGGAAKGFNRASPRVGNVAGRMRCLGGVDVSAAAIRDFDRIVGVQGTVMDLFTRDQYTAFTGRSRRQGGARWDPLTFDGLPAMNVRTSCSSAARARARLDSCPRP